MSKLRPIAIYLPQYHPIKENNEWWGKGFTEWTNVTKAKPFYEWHYQPQLPTDLGFYDLRLNDVFYDQIQMAKDAGLYGFMFYHYWFEGQRLLEKPLENYLADKKIDFPFFLCWANENWTRRWDGADQEVLMKQDYSVKDFSEHFDAVFARFIIDERYIKVEGKPVIAVYKTELIPNVKELSNLWNEKAKSLGLPGVYLLKVDASDWDTKPNQIGFDANMEFQPFWRKIHDFKIPASPLQEKIENTKPNFLKKILENKYGIDTNKVYDYVGYSKFCSGEIEKDYTYYRCVMPSWDNSARRRNGNAVIFKNANPTAYGEWLKKVVELYKPKSKEENFIFINAWNEWAEGNRLEPCIKFGREYLDVTKKVLNETNK